jgi:excisionase family DNA binding protein
MKTDEVADKLGVSRTTVTRWLRERKLNGKIIDGVWYVSEAEVERFQRYRHEYKRGRQLKGLHRARSSRRVTRTLKGRR